MKTLSVVLVVLFLLPPVKFFSQESPTQSVVNGWVPMKGFFDSRSESFVGSVIKGDSQVFFTSGVTIYNGYWHTKGTFYKEFVIKKLPERISITGLVLKSTPSTTIEIVIAFQDDLGSYCGIREKIRYIKDTEEVFEWIIPDEAKAVIKNIKTFYIGLTNGASDSSYIRSEVSLRNLKFDNEIIDFNFSSVGIEEETIPTEYMLFQNYPNPFNPSTTIKFVLPKAGNVKLTVYDITGKEVKTLVNSFMNAGTHNIQFNASTLASGVYLYRIQSDNYVKVNNMLLVK